MGLIPKATPSEEELASRGLDKDGKPLPKPSKAKTSSKTASVKKEK